MTRRLLRWIPRLLAAPAFGLILTTVSAAASGSWTIVSSPNGNTSVKNRLFGVACAAAANCWAVGEFGQYSQNTFAKTLIEHYDGSGWTLISSPNAPGDQTESILYSVTCATVVDCVAAGTYADFGNNTGFRTLIEHYNGTGWSIVGSADPYNYYNILYGAACLNSNDCFAVGVSSNGNNYQTLIEENTGTGWSVVVSPNSNGSQDNFLSGVTCLSASDCVAVGYYNNGTTANPQDRTLITENSGSGWAIVSSPNPSPSQDAILSGVECTNQSACLAVGNSYDGSSDRTLIEQSTTSGWALVSSPNSPTGSDNFLSSVTCINLTDCIAVGAGYYNGSIHQTLIEENTGTGWALVPSANTSSTQENLLNGIACDDPASCIAVGAYFNGSSNYQTLVEQNSAPSTNVPEWPTGPITGLGFGSAVVVLERRMRRGRPQGHVGSWLSATPDHH